MTLRSGIFSLVLLFSLFAKRHSSNEQERKFFRTVKKWQNTHFSCDAKLPPSCKCQSVQHRHWKYNKQFTCLQDRVKILTAKLLIPAIRVTLPRICCRSAVLLQCGSDRTSRHNRLIRFNSEGKMISRQFSSNFGVFIYLYIYFLIYLLFTFLH